MADVARWIQRRRLDPRGINHGITLPYELQVMEVVAAMDDVADLMHDLNGFLVSRDRLRLEDTILGNTFSAIISELIVQAVDRASTTLVRNELVGGHPDLIPVGTYESNRIRHGDHGIEVKVSNKSDAWQGHNPEDVWLMAFQYSVDLLTIPKEERAPFQFEKAMIALLEEADWSRVDRSATSRRTPNAPIRKSGKDKLHANAIYERPGYVRGRGTPSRRYANQRQLPDLG